MSQEDIAAIVDNALIDNAAEMKDALYNAINDKVLAAIEQRKIAVAANMLMPQTENTPEEQPE